MEVASRHDISRRGVAGAVTLRVHSTRRSGCCGSNGYRYTYGHTHANGDGYGDADRDAHGDQPTPIFKLVILLECLPRDGERAAAGGKRRME